MDNLSPQEKAEIAALLSGQAKQFHRKLTSNRNRQFAIHAITSLHEEIDTLALRIKKKPNVKFDCKAGCSYCCNLRVEAVAPEIFLLARHLKKYLLKNLPY